jgi:hypothetical protein
MKYTIKLYYTTGIICVHTVTKDHTVTAEDTSLIQTLLEILNDGVLHFIDDLGTEIYFHGTYYITSKEGHNGY